MLADHCLNMTGENTVVISDDCNGLPPSKEDVRQDIWWYMVVLASASTVIFVAMVAYFPSKPSLPPSQSGMSNSFHGENFTPPSPILIPSFLLNFAVTYFHGHGSDSRNVHL